METDLLNYFQHSHNFLLDFIAGSIAGFALTISGHPFE